MREAPGRGAETQESGSAGDGIAVTGLVTEGGPASDDPDVFGARSLRALARVERHCLAFPQLVELPIGAGRLMKEVLVTVRASDEPKALFADQPLNCSIRCHIAFLVARLVEQRHSGREAEMTPPGVRARLNLRQYGQTYSLYVS